jgi:hypothetical protein
MNRKFSHYLRIQLILQFLTAIRSLLDKLQQQAEEINEDLERKDEDET